MNYSPAIVIVAFNRPNSLIRLLKYLEIASFNVELAIPLVISIDFQNSDEHGRVKKVAEEFHWKYGIKKIIAYEQNLGLREHILKCGDLTEEYGSIILLEDDILVAPSFYEFGRKAAAYYDDETEVAGISLYSYEYEELGLFRFYAMNKGSDTYFMQWAASWGQLWTKKQWCGFREWYSANKNIAKTNIPDRVKKWDKSWKKFYIAYLVEKNKFFVYPYISYTTLTEDMGTHIKSDAQVNNVHISNAKNIENINFSDISQNDLKYDCFFQPLDRHIYLPSLKKKAQVSFDIFGTKSIKNILSDYVFTSKTSKGVVQKYSNKLIPYELNLLHHEVGDILVLSKKSNLFENRSLLAKSRLLSSFRKKNSVKDMLHIVIGKIHAKIFNRS